MTRATLIPEVLTTPTSNRVMVGADEVARVLNTHVQTVRRWAHDGVIPHVRVGDRLMRFNLADVLDALKGNAPATRRTRGATTHRPAVTTTGPGVNVLA